MQEESKVITQTVEVMTKDRQWIQWFLDKTAAEEFNKMQAGKRGGLQADDMVGPSFYPDMPVPISPREDSILDIMPVVSSIRAGLYYYENGNNTLALLFFTMAVADAVTLGRMAGAPRGLGNLATGAIITGDLAGRG